MIKLRRHGTPNPSVSFVDGRPDETLEDLARVDLVVKNGTIVVRDGRVSVPRHEALQRTNEKPSW